MSKYDVAGWPTGALRGVTFAPGFTPLDVLAVVTSSEARKTCTRHVRRLAAAGCLRTDTFEERISYGTTIQGTRCSRWASTATAQRRHFHCAGSVPPLTINQFSFSALGRQIGGGARPTRLHCAQLRCDQARPGDEVRTTRALTLATALNSIMLTRILPSLRSWARLSSRDVCIVGTQHTLKDGSLVMAMRSVVDPLLAEVPDRVRANAAMTGWKLTPKDNGTQITCVMQTASMPLPRRVVLTAYIAASHRMQFCTYQVHCPNQPERLDAQVSAQLGRGQRAALRSDRAQLPGAARPAANAAAHSWRAQSVHVYAR